MKDYRNVHAKTPYTTKIYHANEVTANLLKSFNFALYGVRSYPPKKYIDLCCAFDIETYTNEVRNDDGDTIYAQAYMYIWQFSINNTVIYGRTWYQLIDILSLMEKTYKLSKSNRLIIWVANLSYECQFIRKWLNITEQFSKEKRQPLYFTHNECIEFHDALPISGGGLSYLAKQYTNTQKCVGDLDYTIPRNKHTTLSDEELSYCYNDVIILSEFARYIFDTYIIPMHFVPLTKTQILLKRMKLQAYEDYGRKKITNMIKLAFPAKPYYDILMNYCFRGGYVHGNMMYTGRIFDINNGDRIESYDFTSSYPSVMVKDYVPYAFHAERDISLENVLNLMAFRCVIIYATFTNVMNTTWHSIESTHKCVHLVNPVIDNGRVLSCDSMSVVLTEIDYQTYTEFYKWDNMTVHWCLWAQRIPMPDYIVKSITRDYTAKQHNKTHGLPYQVEKETVNTYYGACVKRLSVGRVTYTDDEWGEEDDYEQFEKQVKSSITLPQWGIYVTAHARRRLLSTITTMGTVPNGTPNDALYCDTDSIKVQNAHLYESIFSEYNAREEQANKELCEKYDLDFSLFHDLGCFEREYNSGVLKLKYLGAKRYMRDYLTKKGERVTEVTCAGVPKGKINEYAQEQNQDPYDIFHDELELQFSGKMCSHYNDEESQDYITDLQGHRCLMCEKSNVALTETSFTLTIDRLWKETILEMWRFNKRKEFRL